MLAPAFVVCGHGAGAQRAEVGAGLRLGQVHRPGPFAGDELVEIKPLLLGRTVRFEESEGAVIEQWAQRPAHARRVPHLDDRHRDRDRETLAAVLRAAGETVPAGLDVLAIGLAEPWRGAHNTVFEDAAESVADWVQWRQFSFGEFRRFVEDGVSEFGRLAG